MWRAGAMAAMAILALPVGAEQSHGTFAVNVELKPVERAPSTALCKIHNAAGIEFSVVCGEVSPVISRPTLYHLSVSLWGGEGPMGNVDLYSGAGTITSWRIVRLTNREYLEMTVGW